MAKDVVSAKKQRLEVALDRLLIHLQNRDQEAICKMFDDQRGELKHKFFILRKILKYEQLFYENGYDYDGKKYCASFTSRFLLDDVKQFVISKANKSASLTNAMPNLSRIHAASSVEDLVKLYENISTVESQCRQVLIGQVDETDTSA